MAKPFRQDEPPRPGPQYPILRIKGTTPTRYQIFSRALLGLWTHWVNECSMPCIDPREECPHCKTRKPRRWKGYIHAQDMRSAEEGFLELTPGGAKQIRTQAGAGNSLRGLQVLGSRGNGQKTRQKVEVVFALPSTADRALPDERDPMTTLLELWGLKGFRLRSPEEDDLDESSVAS